MVFKDINCGFYTMRRPGLYACTMEEVDRVAGDHHIAAMAVYHCDRGTGTVRQTNDVTLKICGGSDGRKTPVVRLLAPGYAEESYTREEMYRLISEDRAIFRIHPALDACPLTLWMFDWMIGVLTETRTPLLVSLQELDLRDAAAVKEKYPALRLVITNTTQWMNRQYIRFAQHYPGVYFDTSNIIEYYGIENVVNILGAERILFGTYMPEKEPYDKVFQLMYCELTDEQKQMIAYGNYDRLVGVR
jgi:hypothetical protein